MPLEHGVLVVGNRFEGVGAIGCEEAIERTCRIELELRLVEGTVVVGVGTAPPPSATSVLVRPL